MTAWAGLTAGLALGGALVTLAIDRPRAATVCGIIFGLLVWGMHG